MDLRILPLEERIVLDAAAFDADANVVLAHQEVEAGRREAVVRGEMEAVETTAAETLDSIRAALGADLPADRDEENRA